MLFGRAVYVLLIIILLACFLCLFPTGKHDEVVFRVGRQQKAVKSIELSDDQFKRLSRLENREHFREVLNNILIPRVVGSEGHRQVRNYLVESMKALDWKVETDMFEDEAPIKGKLKFENVIAMLNPKAERFLVLACHYDSKYMPDFEFLGATDSAVPCALLINVAYVLKEELKKIKDQKLSLMFVFFDGEEAFDTWGPTDSIYGARHLAKKWSDNGNINRLDMLVVLDLLGARDPQFYNFFPDTKQSYSKLASIEESLSHVGMLERYTSSGVIKQKPNRYFKSTAPRYNFIEDDHVPFHRLGVPVIHLIPTPFPDIWHTKDDDINIVDFHTTENLSRIIRLFIMEYLLAN